MFARCTSFNGLMLYGAGILPHDPYKRLDFVVMNQYHWNRALATVIGTSDIDAYVIAAPNGPFQQLDRPSWAELPLGGRKLNSLALFPVPQADLAMLIGVVESALMLDPLDEVRPSILVHRRCRNGQVGVFDPPVMIVPAAVGYVVPMSLTERLDHSFRDNLGFDAHSL